MGYSKRPLPLTENTLRNQPAPFVLPVAPSSQSVIIPVRVIAPDDPQVDTDRDGVPDAQDGCPQDDLKTSPGSCGCGQADFDFDSDQDGTPDCVDLCPADPAKTSPGACGCNSEDTDRDGDCVADCREGPFS